MNTNYLTRRLMRWPNTNLSVTYPVVALVTLFVSIRVHSWFLSFLPYLSRERLREAYRRTLEAKIVDNKKRAKSKVLPSIPRPTARR